MPDTERCPEGHLCELIHNPTSCDRQEMMYYAQVICLNESACDYRSPMSPACTTMEEARSIARARHNALMRSAAEAARLREGIEALMIRLAGRRYGGPYDEGFAEVESIRDELRAILEPGRIKEARP